MKSVYKYELDVIDEQWIDMPIDAEPLCVQVQKGCPCIWVLVNTNDGFERRRFVTHGTGHRVLDTAGAYIGTYQLDGGELVFHVFEGGLAP